MNYWLFKTEPSEFSISDLASAPEQKTRWNGIRNYQARNFIRDQIQPNDTVLIYHSGCKHIAVVGSAKVVSPAYADPEQFDSNSAYYDPKSNHENPRWVCVDIQLLDIYKHPLSLAKIKKTRALEEMILIKQGRLSIQPVRELEYEVITQLTKAAH